MQIPPNSLLWSAEKGMFCLQVSSLGVYTSEDYVRLKHTYYCTRLCLVFPERENVKTKCSQRGCMLAWTSVTDGDKPRTARISGIVKPFEQLRIRSHSHFDHVGVRFHLEGPVVSTAQTQALLTCTSVRKITIKPQKFPSLYAHLTSLIKYETNESLINLPPYDQKKKKVPPLLPVS